MAFRAGTVATGAASTLVVNTPAGVANGDQMLCFFEMDSATASMSQASWTSLGLQQNATPDGASYQIFTRVASSEPASYTFTFTGTGQQQAQMACWSGRASGALTSSNIQLTSNTSANASPVAVSMTGVTAVAGDDIAVFVAMDSTVGTDTFAYSTITGYTNQTTTNGGLFVSTNFQLLNNSSAGATGALAITATRTGTGNAGYAGWVIRIPAASSSAYFPIRNFNGPGRGPRATQHFLYKPFSSGSTVGVLGGVSAATTAATGNLTGAGALGGASVFSTIGIGNLSGSGALSGISVTSSVATGNLQGTGVLSGISVVAMAATGNLVGTGNLAGVAVASSAGVGNLAGAGALSGTSVATTAATGNLTGAGALSGIAVSTSVATGDLQALSSGSISGVSVATTVGIGDLGGAGILSGTAVFTTVGVGNLTAAGGAVGSTLNVGFICNIGTLDNPVPRA